jgi:hypothetical protein
MEGTMRLGWMAAATMAACVGLASAASADVTLIRGSFVETVPAGNLPTPTVLRGARALPATAAPTATPAPVEAAAPRPAVIAGRVLWRIDAESGGLQACWLRGTGVAGENGIFCTSP